MYAGGEKNLRDQGQFSRALPSVEGFASTYHRARSRGRWWCRPAGVRGCGLSEIQSWLQLVLSPFPCLPPGFLFWGQGAEMAIPGTAGRQGNWAQPISNQAC